jgi:hypothetical protein
MSLAKHGRGRTFGFTFALLFLSDLLQAQVKCPVEIKLLLSPPTIQTVIASVGFEKETATRVYFFDTDALDLLKQGVIVRVRQGADNDLTVKVRESRDNREDNKGDNSQLRKHFPCEIDQTGAGENTSYAVRRKYKTPQVPEMGKEIFNLVSPPQQKLLRDARISIDWARVKRIANIKSTKWETTTQPPFRKLALELWESQEGNILEVSTKIEPDAAQSTNAELRRLVRMKNLSLSTCQGTKTRMVLETLTDHTLTPK